MKSAWILFDQSTLDISVHTVLSGILAASVLYGVVVNSSSSGQATAVLLESRLYIWSFALWAIITGFTVTTSFCVFLVCTTRNDKFHQELGTIAVYGALLSTSDATRSLLKGHSDSQTPQIEAKFGDATFGIMSNDMDHVLETRPADFASPNMAADKSGDEVGKT